MKKLFLFLILGIALVSFGGCDPIEVVKYTITATYDANVTVSPASVVVESGDTVTLKINTDAGYKSTVKVNGKVVSLTSVKVTFSDVTPDSSILTLSNVTSDIKVEATSIKIKQYTITIITDSNGTLDVLTPAVTVVDSGKPCFMNIFFSSNLGYVIDKFKVNGVEKTWHPASYNFGKVNCDQKVEFTTKEMSIDPYFFGIKWRMDSIYSRVPGLAGYEEYSLYLYIYPGNRISYFYSNGQMLERVMGELRANNNPWSVDKTTNPNILSFGFGLGHANDRKVEVRTNKKLVLSNFQVSYNQDGSIIETDEFKVTYIPEP